MNRLKLHPTLVDQIYEEILSEIAEGKFNKNNRLK